MEKMPHPRRCPRHCASLRGRHVTGITLNGKNQKFLGKMSRPKTATQSSCMFLANLRSRNSPGHIVGTTEAGNLQKMFPRRALEPIVCKPAKVKCTCTCHKSNCLRKFANKRPQSKNKPDLRRAFCVSRRNRNAQGHGLIYFYPEFCGENAALQSIGFDLYRQNLAMWTCCTGKNRRKTGRYYTARERNERKQVKRRIQRTGHH